MFIHFSNDKVKLWVCEKELAFEKVFEKTISKNKTNSKYVINMEDYSYPPYDWKLWRKPTRSKCRERDVLL